MKLIFVLLLTFPSIVLGQDITFSEAMELLDKHASTMNKLEVGERLIEESFQMHPGCVVQEKIISTVVEVKEKSALILRDYNFENKCTGEKKSKKYLIVDEMIQLEKVKKVLAQALKGYKVHRMDTLLKFEKVKSTERHTYHYDLRFNLFSNWVHHHHTLNKVEDHNTKNATSRLVVPMSEIEGLPICEIDVMTRDLVKCN